MPPSRSRALQAPVPRVSLQQCAACRAAAAPSSSAPAARTRRAAGAAPSQRPRALARCRRRRRRHWRRRTGFARDRACDPRAALSAEVHGELLPPRGRRRALLLLPRD
eukprot:1330548-Prymnesium_polylepis.1